MPEILTPDLCVLGAGAAGLAAAKAAAALNLSVAVVEKVEMGGAGRTIALAAKALRAAADIADAMRRADPFGVSALEPRVNFGLIQKHIAEACLVRATNDSPQRLAAIRVRLIQAHARFVSRDTCQAGGHMIRARRFVIATGARTHVPNLPGIELVRPLTPDTLFDLINLPPRLIILGGSAWGVEMAQAFRRLGAEVTLLDAGALLANEDPELAHPLLAALTREGVVLRENVIINRIEPRGSGVRLFLSRQTVEETIDGSHLLVLGERRPVVDGLGLEAAGVAFDREGVKVSAGMRTSNRRIHAIGDVLGGEPSVHAAEHQAGIALRAAFLGAARNAAVDLIPRIVHGDPAIASVGLNEAMALRSKQKLRILRYPMGENDCAQAERETAGLIKLIVDRNGGILGAGITSRHAGEMIGQWSLAVRNKIKIDDMASVIAPYPTRGDIARQVALAGFSERLRSPWLAHWLNLSRRFG